MVWCMKIDSYSEKYVFIVNFKFKIDAYRVGRLEKSGNVMLYFNLTVL